MELEQNFIENSLIILTKQTCDLLLSQEKGSDLIALYVFYYYTAKWQGTNQPRCTTSYASDGLGWNVQRLRKAKKQLIELGLISDVKTVDESNKITGHYIKMNYIFKKETENNHRVENSTGGKNDGVENQTPNALSVNNINALSDSSKNASSVNKENANNKNNKKVELENKIIQVIDHLNEKANTRYRYNSINTVKCLKALLTGKNPYTVEDCITVIDKKCSEWIGTNFEQYLRPNTLFGNKFEGYLNSKVKPNSDNNQYQEQAKKKWNLKGVTRL